MNTLLCLTAVGLACAALGLALVALLGRSETRIIITVPDYQAPKGPKALQLPPIEEWQQARTLAQTQDRLYRYDIPGGN